MNLEEGFLQDIIANPDDDTPRLVYADWLEDQGEYARAAFIRKQIEEARLRDNGPGEAEPPDEAESGSGEEGQDWDGELRSLVGDFTYRRGFIEEVHLDGNSQLEHTDRIARLAPVRRLRVEGADAPLSRLVKSALLHHLLSLDVRGSVGRKELKAFLAAPRIRNLRNLELRSGGIGDAGTRLVAQCPHLVNLRGLNLGYNLILPRGARALGGSPYLRNLEKLDLHFNELREDGTRGLVEDGLLARVRELELGFNEIGDGGMAALAGARVGPLTHLVVSHAHASSNGLIQLVGSAGYLESLVQLELQFNNVTSDGAAALASCAALRSLRYLDLSKNQIGPEGAVALARSQRLVNLRHLDLETNPIGHEGGMALAKSPALERLTRLTVRPEDVSEEAVEALNARFGPRMYWYS